MPATTARETHLSTMKNTTPWKKAPRRQAAHNTSSAQQQSYQLRMKIPFHTPGRKWLVAVPTLALMIGYLGLTATQFAASWLGTRVELTSLRRSAWLDPGNAD